MSHRLSSLLLPVALLVSMTAGAADWRADGERSTLSFRASAQGEAFDGRFARFTARIRFDPEALADSRFDVDIDVASVDSRNSERDEMLAEREFFDVVRQPQAHYRAERFTALGPQRFRADGLLTLRGVERPVPLEFTWQADDAGARLEGEATLDRLAFDVGAGEWADPSLIAREVTVRTLLQLVPAAE